MKIVALIVQILTLLAFGGAGVSKLITPYAEMAADPNMQWVNDFAPWQIQIISALEVLGALGLVLPEMAKKYYPLVPASAIGLALIMVGAAVTHMLRQEPILVNMVLFGLALITAWFRRGYFQKPPRP